MWKFGKVQVIAEQDKVSLERSIDAGKAFQLAQME